jgi:hypothetical protein
VPGGERAERAERRIHSEAIYGFRTRLPIVQVTIPRAALYRDDAEAVGLQLEAADAEALALDLLRVAEAAVSDGFLVSFLAELLEQPPEQLAPVLTKFRGYRARHSREGT